MSLTKALFELMNKFNVDFAALSKKLFQSSGDMQVLTQLLTIESKRAVPDANNADREEVQDLMTDEDRKFIQRNTWSEADDQVFDQLCSEFNLSQFAHGKVFNHNQREEKMNRFVNNALVKLEGKDAEGIKKRMQFKDIII